MFVVYPLVVAITEDMAHRRQGETWNEPEYFDDLVRTTNSLRGNVEMVSVRYRKLPCGEWRMLMDLARYPINVLPTIHLV